MKIWYYSRPAGDNIAVQIKMEDYGIIPDTVTIL